MKCPYCKKNNELFDNWCEECEEKSVMGKEYKKRCGVW